jgi:hypothetical protein
MGIMDRLREFATWFHIFRAYDPFARAGIVRQHVLDGA